MYVILVNEDNTLSAPRKERIIQRSKLVDNLWFLVKPTYKGLDTSACSVLLEYVLPVSRKYCTELLVLSEDKYEDHLKYVLPVDTQLTTEAGKIELQLTFIYVDIGTDGKPVQRVRKIAPPHKLDIVPISAWSDLIPDSALSAIDQRIIKVDAQIKALDDMNKVIIDGKADNLSYEDNKLQLVANGKKIGDEVVLNGVGGGNYDDGIPVVDLDGIFDIPDIPDNPEIPDDEHDCPSSDKDVVEF